MLRKCWNCIVFHSSDPRLIQAPYVPRRIRSRLNAMLLVSAVAAVSVFFMTAVSVLGQVPPVDVAVKLADVVEHKSPSWIIALTAIAATGANLYLVKVIIQLVKDSIGASSDVKRELSIIKALVRGRNVEEETPER